MPRRRRVSNHFLYAISHNAKSGVGPEPPVSRHALLLANTQPSALGAIFVCAKAKHDTPDQTVPHPGRLAALRYNGFQPSLRERQAGWRADLVVLATFARPPFHGCWGTGGGSPPEGAGVQGIALDPRSGVQGRNSPWEPTRAQPWESIQGEALATPLGGGRPQPGCKERSIRQEYGIMPSQGNRDPIGGMENARIMSRN